MTATPDTAALRALADATDRDDLEVGYVPVATDTVRALCDAADEVERLRAERPSWVDAAMIEGYPVVCGQRDEYKAELQARELHHFETEQENVRLRALLTEAADVIHMLGDQQAMPDDWYVEPLTKFRKEGTP